MRAGVVGASGAFFGLTSLAYTCTEHRKLPVEFFFAASGAGFLCFF